MYAIISSRYLIRKRVYSLEEDTMRDKSIFIFRCAIVIAFVVIAAVAFVYSLSVMPMDQKPEQGMISEAENGRGLQDTAGPEQDMPDGILPFPGTGVDPQETMKCLIFLFSVGGIICTQMRNKNGLQFIAGVVYALVITFLLGKWSLHMAYLERGYETVGGEYCLVYIVGLASGMAIEHFFESLEDWKYGRICKKEESRTDSGI